MQLIFTQLRNLFLKALAFFTLLIFLSKESESQMCTNPGGIIYGLSGNGNIVPITVSNASVGTAINATPFASSGSIKANAMGYNIVNGIFYYFQNNTAGSLQFLSFNPATNVYTVLASSPITGSVNRGCVSFNGTGYYCIDTNGNLCYYDILHNTWALITNNYTDQYGNNISTIFTSESSGDMAIDGLGNLWIVSSNSSQWGLYKLSAPLPTNSTASIAVKQLIAPTTATPGGKNFAGIAFNPTGEIYMSTDNDLYLLQTSYTLSYIGSFTTSGVGSDITSCNFPFGILPVSWVNFNASLQSNKSVSVSWEVSQQVNNKGYYVEHSIDGAKWDELGFVANSGSFKSSEQYAFTDNNPFSGKNYYRIRQVDLDGTANYSEIKAVTVESFGNSQVSVWPNPAKDVIKIQNNNDANIARIYNQSGALVNESKLHSGVNTVNVSSLSFGAYIISVKMSNGENYNQKFIKQ